MTYDQRKVRELGVCFVKMFYPHNDRGEKLTPFFPFIERVDSSSHRLKTWVLKTKISGERIGDILYVCERGKGECCLDTLSVTKIWIKGLLL